jgi:uncharacterized protein
MQPNNYGYQQPSVTRVGADVDPGLKAHMQRVYNRMTAGVLITGLTAWLVSNSAALMGFFMGGPQAYVVMLAPLAIILFGFRPERMAPNTLMMVFGLLSVVYGISFSVIFKVFTGESIAQAFFMSTALFAGLSIFGYTTKKNLTGLGTFAFMAMWAVFVVAIGTMIAGAFGVDVSMMQTILSGATLLVFSAMTAWETQSTKEMYHASHGDDANSRAAWAAALNLYISFIAIFQSILNLLGNRE